jgi:hypothetical protein
MSGPVVELPAKQHSCSPGWTWHHSETGPVGPGMYGTPPSAYLYPEGTLWHCDCGTTWVSTGPLAWNAPGSCGWEREGWLARWRRTRAAKP